MTLLDKLHEQAAKIGISPKLLDPILAAIVLYVANGLLSGEWELDELKTAIAAVLLTAVSVLAPPAAGVSQAEVDEISRAKRVKPAAGLARSPKPKPPEPPPAPPPPPEPPEPPAPPRA